MHHSSVAVLFALAAKLVYATNNTSPNLGPGKVLPSGWSYYGCYTDDISNRVLASDHYTDLTGMSEGSCMVYCGSKGYTFAGLEYGSECYCGFGLKSSSTKDVDSSCDYICPGAQGTGDACGGQDRLSVFTTGGTSGTNKPVVNDYCYAGCYVDTVDNRILNAAKSDGDDMTVEQCTSTCKAQGFSYAGLENGSECFCGSSLLSGAQQVLGNAVDSGCDILCKGDSTEWCGGAGRLSLYSTGQCAPKPSSISASPSSSWGGNYNTRPAWPKSSSTFSTSVKSSSKPWSPPAPSKPAGPGNPSGPGPQPPVPSKPAGPGNNPSPPGNGPSPPGNGPNGPNGPGNNPSPPGNGPKGPGNNPSPPGNGSPGNGWPSTGGSSGGSPGNSGGSGQSDNGWDDKGNSGKSNPISSVFSLLGSILGALFGGSKSQSSGSSGGW